MTENNNANIAPVQEESLQNQGDTVSERDESLSEQNILQEEETGRAKAEKHRKIRRAAMIFPVLAIVLIVGILFTVFFAVPEWKYKKAVRCYNEGKVQEAQAIFYGLLSKQADDWAYDFSVGLGGGATPGAIETQILNATRARGYKESFAYYNRIKAVPRKEILTKANGEKTVIEREFTFDQQGRILSVSHPSNGVDLEEYEYDADGNLIRKTETKPDGIKINYEYTYDGEGNLIRVREPSSDGLTIYKKTEYFYDVKGNCIRAVSIENSGEEESAELKYNKKGNLIKKTTKETDYHGKEEQQTFEISYSWTGRLSGIKVYNESGRETETTKFKYDWLGRLVKVKEKNEGERIIEYKYDLAGRLVEITEQVDNSDASLTYETVCKITYDKNGHEEETEYTFSDASKEQFKEKYDKSGNCVKSYSSAGVNGGSTDFIVTEYKNYVYYIDPEYGRARP